MPRKKGYRRLEPDSDEQGQENQHQSRPYGVNGRAEGQRQQDACRGHEADDEGVAPVEGLPQATQCPLPGPLLHCAGAPRQLSRNCPLFEPSCTAVAGLRGPISHWLPPSWRSIVPRGLTLLDQNRASAAPAYPNRVADGARRGGSR